MLSRAEEKLIIGLSRRRRREAERLFLAEGVRVVEELLEAGLAPRLTVVAPALHDTQRGEELARRLTAHTEVRQVSDTVLRRLASTQTPQGVLVVAETPSAELRELRPDAGATALVLDGVQDPGNIGTLTRTAAAFGCELLVALPGTADPWSPKSVRASAGALFRLPVAQEGVAPAWDWFSRHGFTVLGAEAHGQPISAGARSGPAALVVGNEGAGLSADVRERCHRLVSVPMRGSAESLNVAVAAAILIYELTRELG